ncbi:MAG: SRPBCC family protein [Thermoleophilaceae bacterium]
MRPVEASIVISAPRGEVFDFVADIAGRVAWTDHFLKDFRLTRVNPVGVGAGAAFLIDAPLFRQRAELQVVTLERPRRIVERSRIGRLGRTTGWNEWEFADDYGSTEVRVSVWTEPGTRWDAFRESLGARGWLKRQVRGGLRRLRQVFEERPERPLARATIAGYEPLKAARFGYHA